MPKYKITNKDTNEIKEVVAEFLGTAVTSLGWEIDHCLCEVIKDGETPAKKGRGRPKKNSGEGPTSKPAPDDQAQAKNKDEAETGGAQSQEPLVDPGVVAKARKAQAADQADAEAQAKFQKDLEKEVESIDPHGLIGNPTEAETKAYTHKQEIERFAIEAEVMFLRMGQLLFNARIDAEWTVLHYETYREYVEDLKLPMTNSYSWATRLSSIYEYMVKNMKLDEKLLAEIGVAKLTRLIPLARKGELTDEVLEAARVLSDLDLRQQLGHNVGDGGDTQDLVICPHCGETFDAKKANRP